MGHLWLKWVGHLWFKWVRHLQLRWVGQLWQSESLFFWEICSKNTGLQGSTLSGPHMTMGFGPKLKLHAPTILPFVSTDLPEVSSSLAIFLGGIPLLQSPKNTDDRPLMMASTYLSATRNRGLPWDFPHLAVIKHNLL